jgi:Uma2 family endonuclease
LSTLVFFAEMLIMAIVNRINEQEYRELALSEQNRLWELWDGVPREKPLMSMKHEDVASYLGAALIVQLDRRLYRVNINGGRARLSPRSYYIPDVVVIPAAYKLPFEDDPRAFNAFAEPLPLVVEIWSPSTGHYDVSTKLQGYRERGDSEIWFIHPYERTLSAWRRQSDESYAEEIYRGGVVPVASLPGVVIDFDALLDG